MQGLIYNRCPQMDALRTSDPRIRIAQILYTNIVIILNGKRYTGWAKFPDTVITRTGLLRAVVAPCEAIGLIDGGGIIRINLPEERVIGPEALPVKGEGECHLAEGGFGKIDITYGAVLAMPEGDGDWLVGCVNAKGTVTF